jgi:hypothetical protein
MIPRNVLFSFFGKVHNIRKMWALKIGHMIREKGLKRECFRRRRSAFKVIGRKLIARERIAYSESLVLGERRASSFA